MPRHRKTFDVLPGPSELVHRYSQEVHPLRRFRIIALQPQFPREGSKTSDYQIRNSQPESQGLVYLKKYHENWIPDN